MIERADREGVPVMLGWMCCMQWEHWNLWNAEDQWVARASLVARLRELRAHASVVLSANGIDGLPPDLILNDYRQIEKDLHWQNAIVDTVADRNRTWSGIHMEGCGTTDDDLGSAKNDDQFTTKLAKWSDLTALDATNQARRSSKTGPLRRESHRPRDSDQQIKSHCLLR